MSFPERRMRRLRSNPVLRGMVAETRLGVDENTRTIARLLTSDAHLNAMQRMIPEAQYNALYLLAGGLPVEEVWAEVAQYAASGTPQDEQVDTRNLVKAMERMRDVYKSKLVETRVLTCASPAYLERRGVPRTPHDLTHHECLLFRDPQTGRPFPWEFHRGKEIIEIAVTGRVMMDDPSAAVAACIAGQGVFQSLEIGLRAWFASGELVHILPDWSNERWPLYAYHPSRHLPPAKVRAFLDFVQEIAR